MMWKTDYIVLSGDEHIRVSGPIVPGDTLEEAEQYCADNGMPYLDVQGPWFRELESDPWPDFAGGLIHLTPEEMNAVSAACRVAATKLHAVSGESTRMHLSGPLFAASDKILAGITGAQFEAVAVYADISKALRGSIPAPLVHDYKSVMTLATFTPPETSPKFRTIFESLCSVRLEDTAWMREMTPADMFRVLPWVAYKGTEDEFRERHLKHLRDCFEMRAALDDHFRELLLQEDDEAIAEYVDPFAGPIVLRREPLKTGPMLVDVKKTVLHG